MSSLPVLVPLLSTLLSAALTAPATGGGDAVRSWPVAGVRGDERPIVTRLWEPPASPWGAGHRGVDLSTAPRAEVRAVAAGRVAFAGPVAGRGVVSIELAGTGSPPLRVTYEPVLPLVSAGQRVAAGEVVGQLATGPFHCATPCLHWGLLRGQRYRDPLSLLPDRLLRRGPSRLLPVTGVPLPDDRAAPDHARVAPGPLGEARGGPAQGPPGGPGVGAAGGAATGSPRRRGRHRWLPAVQPRRRLRHRSRRPGGRGSPPSVTGRARRRADRSGT